jgi:PhzF family phenazine biosynthesis protein
VGFCGHATLAAAHAVAECRSQESGGPSDGPFDFETAAGRLHVQPERMREPVGGVLWWLDMPDPGLRPDNTNPMKTCEHLGIRVDDLDARVPVMRTRDDDLILLIQSWQTLVEMRPDMQALRRWCEQHGIRGVLVSTTNTLNASTQAHSRFFAPAAGVPEDPVTGSVHGPLAALLVKHALVAAEGGRAGLHCVQGIPGGRTGLVRALVNKRNDGLAISIAGQCFTTLHGQMRVPEL